MKTLAVAVLFAALFGISTDIQAQTSALSWPEVTQENRPWTRWWWLGSVVDKETITSLLESYEAAGLGGVEITPLYGIRGEEDRFIDFLSPVWMEMLAHTISEARRLNFGVDMATGTGWPFGGPQIDLDHAASMVILEKYLMNAGERLEAPVAYQDENVDEPSRLEALVAVSQAGRVEDVTSHVDAAGMLNWAPPTGDWNLYALFRGWTGQMVKRAAPGAEGFVMNHYERSALERYLHRFDDAFRLQPNVRPRAFFNDSYEAYGADWTPNLLTEFAARHGYDLRHHLPALAGDGPGDIVARVKSDYRETISDLLLNEFTLEWTDWAHAKGSLSRNQSHGSPGNILDFYAATDIPETETFGPAGNPDNDLLIGKFASSAANVSGKMLSSSESATWLREHFTVSLEDLKGVIDQIFVTGINHVFYHGTVYSPPAEEWPGWLFYASTQVNPGNPIWRDLPELNRYIARSQSMLQGGSPDNDVLLYWPIYDNWHDSTGLLMNFPVHVPDWFYSRPFGQLAKNLWDRGYGLDYVSDRLLAPAGVSSENKIKTTGASYEVIVVPATDHMPLETFEKMLNLARAGATVLFESHLPNDVPGLSNLDERRGRLARLKQTVQLERTETTGIQEARLGQGRLLIGDDVHALLRRIGVERESMTDHKGIQYVRRAHEDGHVYFVRNAGESGLDGWVELAVPAASVVLMDAMTEQIGSARTRTSTRGSTETYLQIQPGGSLILQTFDRPVGAEPWAYREVGKPAITITGPWEVEFVSGGPELPASFRADTLPADWTTTGDTNAERFAGTARYSTRFDAPSTGGSWLLDLGEVTKSARVTLNGRILGTLISHPFQIETGALKPSDNLLEIEVTNVAANRIRDLDRRGVVWRKFYDINFVNIDYQPFDSSDWPVRPAGLMGPVRLFPLEE